MGEERQEGGARWWERRGAEAERGSAVLGAEGEGGSCRCGFRKDGIRRRKFLVDVEEGCAVGAEGRPGEMERERWSSAGAEGEGGGRRRR